MPAGNVFKPRRSLTRQNNPVPQQGRQPSLFQAPGQGNPMWHAMNYYPGHPDYVAPGPPTFQEQYRIDHGQNPGNLNFIYGVDDLDENGNPFPKGYTGMQLLGNKGPRSFNPQNQDVLGRAAAALDAIQRDRMSPMGTVSNPEAGAVPQSMMSQSNTGAALYPMNPGRSAPAPGMFSQVMGGVRGLMQQGVNAFNQAYPDQARRDLAQAQSMIGASQNIGDMVSRSRRDNPMAPARDASMDAMNASDEVFNRFQRFQQAAPIPRDSFGAARNSRQAYDQTTAGFSNGYNGMLSNPMMSPDEKLQVAEQNARRVAGGGAAADPTNTRGRFGGTYGMGLNADAADIQNGRAARLADGSVVRFTGTPESARQAYMSARANGYGRTPEQEAARHAKAVEQANARAAKHQAFKDANGGMNYRQYDRMTGGSSGNNALTMKAVREGRLSPEEANYRMQIRAEKALRRAGNPITGGTSQAGQMFPDMTKGRGGSSAAQNPMQAGNPFGLGQGGMTTPEGAVAGRNYLKVAIAGGKGPDGSDVPPNAFLAATGATGDEDNIQDIHFGIQQQVQNNKMPSPDDLKALHMATQAMQAAHGTPNYDPFDMTYGFEGLSDADVAHTKVFGPMYKQLAGMQNPTNEQLMAWWSQFAAKVRPDTSMFNVNPDNKPVFSWGVEYPAGSEHLKGPPSVNPGRNPMLR